MAPFVGQNDSDYQNLTDTHIPTVTEDHLKQFHQAHFADDSLPTSFFLQSQPDLEYEEYEEDDDLGYYQDGVKRTLSDEQIAMFRHSEIQALIKKRQANADEAQSPPTSLAESTLPAKSETGAIFSRNSSKQTNAHQTKRRKKQPRQSQSKRKAEQAALDEAKRRRRNSSSHLSKSGRKVEETRHDPDDFLSDGDGRTYRRKAREADEVKDTPIELDY